MTHIRRSALVLHSAEAMYDLVEDVESYPEFVPWCEGARLISKGEGELVAELEIARGGVRQRFSTRNTFSRPAWMKMVLERGPFSTFSGEWRFTPLGDSGCRVEMVVDFNLESQLLKHTVGKLFAASADRMVEAFCQRADKVNRY